MINRVDWKINHKSIEQQLFVSGYLLTKKTCSTYIQIASYQSM
jgi:hypothetical protein